MIKLSIFIFYIFVQNKSFLKFLPNFNLLRSLELRFIGPLFPRIYSHQWFYLFQVLVENLCKWHHFLKNTTQVEIIITISVTNCTNIRARLPAVYASLVNFAFLINWMNKPCLVVKMFIDNQGCGLFVRTFGLQMCHKLAYY